ncbi:MAG TPA: transketolase [Candidatus Limnocylindrales bacterium]|nr:transketolase [Candidatus Limnocylindrales bacterium]
MTPPPPESPAAFPISRGSLAGLSADAIAVRRLFLTMHHGARAGHIGTGLSCIDLLLFLYRRHLAVGDVFVLSKGHGVSALYATLRHIGRLSGEELATYYKDGTVLAAHPVAGALGEIPAATGSLGHGLPMACGVALAHRTQHQSRTRCVCLLSDGDCNEGSTWEAAAFASHHHLGNLTVVVDRNDLQGFGATRDVLDMEPFADKWRAFGFDVRTIDGHDFAQMDAAMTRATDSVAPLCVIAQTRKGCGISFMENRLEWHYLPMSDEQFRLALAELDEAERRLPNADASSGSAQ